MLQSGLSCYFLSFALPSRHLTRPSQYLLAPPPSYPEVSRNVGQNSLNLSIMFNTNSCPLTTLRHLFCPMKVMWPIFHNVDQLDSIHAAWRLKKNSTPKKISGSFSRTSYTSIPRACLLVPAFVTYCVCLSLFICLSSVSSRIRCSSVGHTTCLALMLMVT